MKFLHEIPRCADTATTSDWTKFQSLKSPERVVRMQEFRDPLGTLGSRFDHVVAVGGFATSSDRSHLVYFWHESLSESRAAGFATQEDVTECVRLFHLLSNFLKAQIDFDDQSGSTAHSQVIAHLRSRYGERLALVWYCRGEHSFVALVRSPLSQFEVFRNVARSGITNGNQSAVEFLALQLEYFLHRSPMHLIAPFRFLLSSIDDDLAKLVSILVNPRYFLPWRSTSRDGFLWPWQECLSVRASDGSLESRSIETCSLVFDLRRSYSAMEQLRSDRAPQFAKFIRDVIDLAHSTVREFGDISIRRLGMVLRRTFLMIVLVGVQDLSVELKLEHFGLLGE